MDKNSIVIVSLQKGALTSNCESLALKRLRKKWAAAIPHFTCQESADAERELRERTLAAGVMTQSYSEEEK